jgi:hypothetical protein
MNTFRNILDKDNTVEIIDEAVSDEKKEIKS